SGDGNEPVAHVACYQVRITRSRIAHAAAAGQMQHQPVAVGDDLETLGAELRTALQLHAAGCAQQPAIAALRRMRDAVEYGVAGEFKVALGGDLHRLAEAAARASGAAGIRAQILAP